MSRRTFLATFFWKIIFLFWFSDFEQKSCDTFRELLSAIFSELTSMCTEEQIEKTSVLWKIQIFLIISRLWAITQYNFGESGFVKPVKKALYSSRETFWRKQFFEKLYESDLFLSLGKKRLARCSNCFLCPVEQCWKFEPFGENQCFFCRFHTLCELFPQLQTKLAGLSS